MTPSQPSIQSRRHFLRSSLATGLAATGLAAQGVVGGRLMANSALLTNGSGRNPKWESATRRGLDYLARTQSSRGQWNTPPYPVAVSALAGLALLCSGSTVTQGPYAKQLSRTTDYLLGQSRKNGLIGDP